MRHEPADHEWIAIKPMLSSKPRGVPRVNDRRVLNGTFWVLRSGAPWRDLPEMFGPCTTCYKRFVRSRRAGVWGRIMNALAAALGAAVQIIDKVERFFNRIKQCRHMATCCDRRAGNYLAFLQLA